MAETRPTRVLDIVGNMENDNEQQYVEIGSNIYLGIKDGMKYSLMQTSDSKLRLVEALSDPNMSLNTSKGSILTSQNSEDLNEGANSVHNRSKLIKLTAVKSEHSPCKGQGDEIGNTVIAPPLPISSFKAFDNSLEKLQQEATPENLDDSAELTYTNLLPRQEKRDSLSNAYYLTPRSSFYNYSTTFPPPIAIRPARYTRRPRVPGMLGGSNFSPIPRRGRGSRMRRPRQTSYQYTPQILHSTPTTLPSISHNTDSTVSISESSSSSYSSPSFSKAQSSIEYPRVPNNTPTSPEVDSAGNQKVFSVQWLPHIATEVENYVSLDTRETHNEKERKRRLRIKNACQSMRGLIPCITEKTDNATVFEQAVYFIAFMRESVGNEYDMEFLQENYVF